MPPMRVDSEEGGIDILKAVVLCASKDLATKILQRLGRRREHLLPIYQLLGLPK